MKLARALTFAACLLPVAAFAQVVPPPSAKPLLAAAGTGGNNGFEYWFPARDEASSKRLFDDQRLTFLKNVSISGWTDRGSVFAELIADREDYFRVGIGSIVAAGQQNRTAPPAAGTDASALPADAKANLQKFVAGGGDILGSVLVPIFMVQASNGRHTMAVVSFNPRFGVNVPVLGSSSTSGSLNAQIGSHIYLSWEGVEKNIVVFADTFGGWVTGSDKFYETLSRRSDFLYGQSIVGVRLLNLFQIGVAYPWLAPATIREGNGATVSVSLLKLE